MLETNPSTPGSAFSPKAVRAIIGPAAQLSFIPTGHLTQALALKLDSRAANDAEEICASMRPELLIAHSYRTFVWASIWAAHKGLCYDQRSCS